MVRKRLMELDAMSADAVSAASRVGEQLGFASTHPLPIQETNNTVVWLQPHDVIAKVGKWKHSAETFTREHAVASALGSVGAPCAVPVADVAPVFDEETGFIVTLWQRFDHDPSRLPPPEVI